MKGRLQQPGRFPATKRLIQFLYKSMVARRSPIDPYPYFNFTPVYCVLPGELERIIHCVDVDCNFCLARSTLATGKLISCYYSFVITSFDLVTQTRYSVAQNVWCLNFNLKWLYLFVLCYPNGRLLSVDCGMLWMVIILLGINEITDS